MELLNEEKKQNFSIRLFNYFDRNAGRLEGVLWFPDITKVNEPVFLVSFIPLFEAYMNFQGPIEQGAKIFNQNAAIKIAIDENFYILNNAIKRFLETNEAIDTSILVFNQEKGTKFLRFFVSEEYPLGALEFKLVNANNEIENSIIFNMGFEDPLSPYKLLGLINEEEYVQVPVRLYTLSSFINTALDPTTKLIAHTVINTFGHNEQQVKVFSGLTVKKTTPIPASSSVPSLNPTTSSLGSTGRFPKKQTAGNILNPIVNRPLGTNLSSKTDTNTTIEKNISHDEDRSSMFDDIEE